MLKIAGIAISNVPEELRLPLKAVLQLQAGGAYHPAVAQRDVVSIKNVCAAYGYFDASATAFFSPNSGSKITGNLTYRVTLGAPSLIQTVRVEENTDSETQSLTDALRTSRPGESYRHTAVERDAAALVSLYRERGYLTATVRHTFAPETGMLQFFVDAGKRFVFSYLRTENVIAKRHCEQRKNRRILMNRSCVTWLLPRGSRRFCGSSASRHILNQKVTTAHR